MSIKTQKVKKKKENEIGMIVGGGLIVMENLNLEKKTRRKIKR
jgi:hypothetical protein